MAYSVHAQVLGKKQTNSSFCCIVILTRYTNGNSSVIAPARMIMPILHMESEYSVFSVTRTLEKHPDTRPWGNKGE